MAYKHGVYVSEQPTSIVPPVRVGAGLPVFVGTAPVNQTDVTNVNKPVLCYSYKEAVEAFGFSKDFDKFTLCEAIYSQFALFNVAPVVLINVLDIDEHSTVVAPESETFVEDKILTSKEGIIKSTVTVKSSDELTTYVLGTDYIVSFNDDGLLVITRLSTGTITENATVKVGYSYLDSSKVTNNDIIGGIDVDGNASGLELINSVFPKFRLVPGQILAPKYSTNPAVSAVMKAKASNINQHFRAISLDDIDTDEVKKYTDAAAWKNDNNYVSTYEITCFPKVKLGDDTFHLSTQLAGLICQTDSLNEDIPYVSPSNKSLQCNSAVLKDGKEVWLAPDQAAYLNGEGIVTALNFIGGWKAWGNRTSIYPSVTDPKDAFIPLRRMFNWIGNTLTLTFWQKVDFPINRRLVETILDSANIWLNGLSARQFILGGRIEFREDENPTTDLMDGIIRFHVYVTPPTPAREIDFILEYDPEYLKTLFG